jgi:uncharacterized protein YjbI with pentapeptide repeats
LNADTALAPPKLAGRVVLLAGTLSYNSHLFTNAIIAEGGELVDQLTEKVDLVIELPQRDKAATQLLRGARDRVKRGQGAIEILDYQGFHDRYQPAPDEAVRWLRGGAADHLRFEAVVDARPWEMPKLCIRGERLVGLKWTNAQALRNVRFEDCDLSGADLAASYLGEIHGCKLDGANLEGTRAWSIQKSSLTRAIARRASLPAAECDFSDADLEEYRGLNSQFESCALKRVRLARAELRMAKLAGSDLEEAVLEGANLLEADLTGAKLRGANLAGASLDSAKLKDADLTNADLRGARLPSADLTGAKVGGANFTGALVSGAALAGVEHDTAIGLAAPKPITAGPRLTALAAAVASAQMIETSLRIDQPSGEHVEVKLQVRSGSERYRSSLLFCRTKGETPIQQHYGSVNSIEDGFLCVATSYGDGALRVESIKARSEKSSVSGKALAELVVAAWCELFGVTVVDPAATVAATKRAGRARATSWAEILTTGPRGVRRWNAAPADERPKQLRNLKLAGARLAGLIAREHDFSDADLANALLAEADLYKGKLSRANLAGADLTNAALMWVELREARLDGARLVETSLLGARFRGASLVNADLEGADLKHADLRGADLTGAALAGVLFESTKYDESTKLPAGFAPGQGLEWMGKGAPPEPERPAGERVAIDVSTFMKHLARDTDPDRLKNALGMLKADTFQLFSDVSDGRVAGVVKSQSDAELVYACTLDQRGVFSCCTQNLNTCGGLRGKLCKHLLVLIVGLTRAGALDPTSIDEWVRRSGRARPALDRDAMSEIFLRYKGAEAGEIDWRPVETIPEDYHAL